MGGRGRAKRIRDGIRGERWGEEDEFRRIDTKEVGGLDTKRKKWVKTTIAGREEVEEMR